MKKTLKNILLIGFLTLGIFSFADQAKADANDKLSGYAINSTIGTIIFNCTTNNSCASSSYGVTVDNSGNLSGRAWNANVGWISFDAGDVAGCPSAPCQPHVNLAADDGSVTGFARIVSMGAGQGYIQLSDASNDTFPTGNPAGTQGVSYNFPLHQLLGYAWSADYGWIQFSPTGYTPIKVDVKEPSIDFSINDWAYDNNLDIHGIPHGTPRVTQSAGLNTTVPTVIKWDVQDAQSCSAASTNNDPSWTGPISLSGTATLTITPVLSNQYTIVCTPTYGGVQVVHSLKIASVGFGQAQIPEQYFRKLDDNKTFTLNFIIPSTVNTNSCTVSTEYGPSGTYSGPYASFTPTPAFAGGPGILPNGVSVNYDSTGHAGSIVFQITNPGVISLTNSYFVVFRCMNGTTAVQRVYEYRPNGGGTSGVNLTSTPFTTSAGPIQPNDPVTINYTANYLLASCILHSDTFDSLWDNYVPILNTAPTRSVTVTPPTQTTTYHMDCLDIFGVPVFDSVTVYVDGVAPPPTVTLTAIPSTVSANTGTDLYYTSSNTSECHTLPSTPAANGATGWDGTTLIPNGTTVPEAIPHDVPIMMANTTTTFYIQCTGLDGSTTPAVPATVTILPSAPAAQLSVFIQTAPQPVPSGTAFKVYYEHANTSSCEMENGPQGAVLPPFPPYSPRPNTMTGAPFASGPLPANPTPVIQTNYINDPNSSNIGTQDTRFYVHCVGLDGLNYYDSALIRVRPASGPQQPIISITANSCQSVDPVVIRTDITDPDGEVISCHDIGTNAGSWDISPLIGNFDNSIPLPPPGNPATVDLRCVTNTFGSAFPSTGSLLIHNAADAVCASGGTATGIGDINFEEH